MRIALFYTAVESFNFFADQLDREFRSRGHETFIYDMMNPPEESPHSLAHFIEFVSAKVDIAVCFDGIGVRQEELINTWDAWDTVVIDILMDPPLRLHPVLEKHPKNYCLFCCDRDHVEYVRRYFPTEVPFVDFMPHVGVLPAQDTPVVPYSERKYDILFCGTYYRPQDRLTAPNRMLEEHPYIQELYQLMYRNLIADSDLKLDQALLLTLEQIELAVSEDTLKTLLSYMDNVDWAIRMYQRERVITVLAEAGYELYLLGRGWENHPCAHYPNVHRIDDRIPYGQTLAYMADAKINLNVFPWFKSGTHDRIFNTLLQRSLPLTDRSAWIDNYFTDGEDIAFYDLKHLEELPVIASRLLNNPAEAEMMIQRGYEKVARDLTWTNCADWILDAVSEYHSQRGHSSYGNAETPRTADNFGASQPQISEEFTAFGRQIKPVILGLIANGQWNEAYSMTEQLLALLPGDPEVLEMKQEIMRHIV